MARKPSLGFTPGKHHAYLGHFSKEAFLRDGHNRSAAREARSDVRSARKEVRQARRSGEGLDVAKTNLEVARGLNQQRKAAKAAPEPQAAAPAPVARPAPAAPNLPDASTREPMRLGYTPNVDAAHSLEELSRRRITAGGVYVK